MAQPRDIEQLTALLEEVVTDKGLDLDAVVMSSDNGTPVVRVVVDVPGETDSVDSDTLAAVSRAVSHALDEADPINGEYLLEVSTPGAERELKNVRHWRKQKGRLIRVKLRDKRTLTGRLTEVTEEGVVLDVDGEATTIAYADVKKARPRVEFNSKE